MEGNNKRFWHPRTTYSIKDENGRWYTSKEDAEKYVEEATAIWKKFADEGVPVNRLGEEINKYIWEETVKTSLEVPQPLQLSDGRWLWCEIK